MEHSKTWLLVLIALLVFGVAGCQLPAGRLRVVPITGCYVNENEFGETVGVRHKSMEKTCFFAVQGWQGTPTQRQQLDSLAAKSIIGMAKEMLCDNYGIVYLQYDDDINENTKHSGGDDSNLLTRGIRVVNYSWEKTGSYARGVLFDERGRVVPDEAQGQPSVVVDAKLKMVANPTKQ